MILKGEQNSVWDSLLCIEKRNFKFVGVIYILGDIYKRRYMHKRRYIYIDPQGVFDPLMVMFTEIDYKLGSVNVINKGIMQCSGLV